MKPEMSLIIPSKNRALQLKKCLESISIKEMLETKGELILVNNGSTDNTEEVMHRFKENSSFPVKIINEPKGGKAYALNAAVLQASGEIFVFTDDDCYLADGYLKKVSRIFDSNNFHYCGGRLLLYDATDAMCSVNYFNKRIIIPRHSIVCPGQIAGANMVIHRKVVEKVGLFDTLIGAGTPFAGEDTDYLTRASLAGFKGAFLPELVVYHHHRHKVGSDMENLLKYYARGMGAYFTKFILKGKFTALKYWIPFFRPTRKYLKLEMLNIRTRLFLFIVEVCGGIHYLFVRLKHWVNKDRKPWTFLWILQQVLLYIKERRVHRLPWYAFSVLRIMFYKGFFNQPKEISAMVRVKNEEEYLYPTIKSIIDCVEEVVIIDNLSTDKTPDIIETLCKEYPDKVICYRYPYEVAKFGKDNLKLRNGSFLRFSPNLAANYSQWCLRKCTKSYVLEWDGDQIATEAFYKTIDEFKRSKKALIFYRGINVHPDKKHTIAPINPDMDKLESFLFAPINISNYLMPYSDCEAGLFPKSFVFYDTSHWMGEWLRTPLFHFPQYVYTAKEPLFLHMKYCKSDPYAHYSDDIKKVVLDNITQGPLLNEEWSRIIKRWDRIPCYEIK